MEYHSYSAQLELNFLIFSIDQYDISPNDINQEKMRSWDQITVSFINVRSRRQVKRMPKLINCGKVLPSWWIISFSLPTPFEMAHSVERIYISSMRFFHPRLYYVYQPPVKINPLWSDKERLRRIEIILIRSVSMTLKASVCYCIIVSRNAYALIHSNRLIHSSSNMNKYHQLRLPFKTYFPVYVNTSSLEFYQVYRNRMSYSSRNKKQRTYINKIPESLRLIWMKIYANN